jgi:hypothetical protein
LVPVSLGPSELGSEAAQFCNKDRIKIRTETVQPFATATNKITSKSTLHMVAKYLQTFCYTQVQLMQLISIARILTAIRISGPIARMEN